MTELPQGAAVFLHDLSLWNGPSWVLKGARLSVQRGTLCVLLGANGAGKSSLLAAIAGVLQSPWRISGACLRLAHETSGRAWLAQSLAIVEDMTVEEFLSLGFGGVEGLRQAAATRRSFAEFAIADLAEQRLSALSGGQWQRVRLAQVFASDAELYLLDEPDNALDERWKGVLWKFIDERVRTGATILMAVHRFHDIPSRVGQWVGLEDGRVVFSEDSSGVFPTAFAQRLFLQKSLTR